MSLNSGSAAGDVFVHVRAHGVSHTVTGAARFFRGHTIRRGVRELDDGVFAGWAWDGQRLTVRNDRYGISPLFYWVDQSQVCVSPSLITVLRRGAPPDFDAAGLAAFLRLGYFLGNDTPFAAVRAMPPGAELVWENGRLSCTGGRPHTAVTRVARDAAIDGFIDLCRQAIRRRLPACDRVVMPLSGGRDSRHILFELHAAGVRPRCVTVSRFPPRPAEDERIAPVVASAVGVTHTLLEQNSSRCEAEIRKNWATHLCADEHAWSLPVVSAIASHAGASYDGLGGALSVPNRYHSSEALDLFGRGRTAELADRLIDAYGVHTESFLQRVLRPAAYAALSRAHASERLARELRTHCDAPDPVKSFNFWNRIRRELALTPYSLMRGVPAVYAPYLDHDLYDFLMGLPPTVMSPTLSDGKAFHTDAINRAFPQFAHLPFENKKAAAIDATAHYRRFAAEAAAYVLRHGNAPGRLLNRWYALPRAVYSALRPSFGAARPWFPVVTLYLTQLEMAADSRFATSDPWQAAEGSLSHAA